MIDRFVFTVALSFEAISVPRAMPDRLAAGGPVELPMYTSKDVLLECLPKFGEHCVNNQTVKTTEQTAQQRYIAPETHNLCETINSSDNCNGKAAKPEDLCGIP
jgi:hypothetical protein